VPWSGPNQSPAPKCCTWNLTLAQFRTLRGKMDASNPAASTPAGYLGGTASWRTDLYTGRGTLMTLRESVRLNEKLGVGHTPELKGGDPAQIQAIFGGQDVYAQALIDVLRDEGVDPRRVWLQSFNIDDVVYWVEHAPEFGGVRFTWTTSTRPISRRSPS
jgi:glycerophosphoryl diester phosphodiesterase